jgi:hypothetical protein
MLKLEDFKIKEIETLETITGGRMVDSISGTTLGVIFFGMVLEYGSKLDSCRACDYME